jgi:tRNAThr (cytosine32-N3)-methyltransferase
VDQTVLQAAIKAIDDVHRTDPAGAELAYANSIESWMTRLLGSLDATARLAARCQHLERWVIPRQSYPMTRPGYHAWRQAVQARQGQRASDILDAVGIDAALVERIHDLVAKQTERHDPLAQVLEDAACLVFLDEQLSDFITQHKDYDEERWLRILRRTWAKMSPQGRTLALALPMPEAIRALLDKATGSVY